MQSRSSFTEACNLLVTKYAAVAPSLENSPMRGWTWSEHPVVSSLGYLSRSTTLSMKTSVEFEGDGTLVDDDDMSIMEAIQDEASTTPKPTSKTLACRQYINFSATFRVPCFYFTICRSDGAPLPVNELVKTSLFHQSVLDNTQITPFAVTHPSAPFPLLSQGEHPTLGIPCWYFHPCETASAMEELLGEEGIDEKKTMREERLVRWLEVWFLVMGTVVDLRS